MSNIKVNYKAQILPILIAKSGTSNNSNSKNNTRDNYCSQAFQDILKQKLENNVSSKQDTTQRAFPVFFNKRLAY